MLVMVLRNTQSRTRKIRTTVVKYHYIHVWILWLEGYAVIHNVLINLTINPLRTTKFYYIIHYP